MLQMIYFAGTIVAPQHKLGKLLQEAMAMSLLSFDARKINAGR
jgi:hypothetical protein